MRLGIFILTSSLLFALGGCPPVPTDNGNDNATTNDNSVANGNSNSSANANSNSSANTNSNSSANTNSNSSANTNSNSSANTNSNSSANTNSNSSSNQNANANTNSNTNSNSNTNANSNSNNNTNDNGNTGTNGLTAAEQTVATEAVRLTRDSLQALGLFSGLAQAEINFDTPGNIAVIPGCPEIAYVRSGSDLVAAIDFMSGCSSALTNDVVISGVIELILNVSTHIGDLELMNIVVGGVNYAGTAELAITGGQFNPVAFDGTVDLTAANGFGISGAVDFQVTTTNSKTVTIHSADLTLENNDLSIMVTATNLIGSVINNDSFVPQSGSIVFDAIGSTFTIEFDANSPGANRVRVTVDSDPTVTFTANL